MAQKWNDWLAKFGFQRRAVSPSTCGGHPMFRKIRTCLNWPAHSLETNAHCLTGKLALASSKARPTIARNHAQLRPQLGFANAASSAKNRHRCTKLSSLGVKDRLAWGLPNGSDAARFACMAPKVDNTGRAVSSFKASCRSWPACISWLAPTGLHLRDGTG